MKTLLLLLLSSMITLACSTEFPYKNQDNTLLGLEIGSPPQLPNCTNQQIETGQTNQKCMYKKSGMTEILIPQAENSFPFPIYPISYSSSDNYYQVSPNYAGGLNPVMTYLRSQYGKPKKLPPKIGFNIYEFTTQTIRVELWHAVYQPSPESDAIAIYYFSN